MCDFIFVAFVQLKNKLCCSNIYIMLYLNKQSIENMKYGLRVFVSCGVVRAIVDFIGGGVCLVRCVVNDVVGLGYYSY